MTRLFHKKDSFEYNIIERGIAFKIIENTEINENKSINPEPTVDVIELMILDDSGSLDFKFDGKVMASFENLPENTKFEKYLIGIDEIEFSDSDGRLIYTGYEIVAGD